MLLLTWTLLLLLPFLANAETVAILVAGPDYHHQADVCTAVAPQAQGGIFYQFNKVHVLMEKKAAVLKNYGGADVSSACTVTHTPRLESLKEVFSTLTTLDEVTLFFVGLGHYRVFTFPTDESLEEVTRDYRNYKMLHYTDFVTLINSAVFKQMLIVADFEESASLFPAGSLPNNALAITSPTNVATHCFETGSATHCRSHKFLGTLLRQQGPTLNSIKATIRALYSAGLEDVAVHVGSNVTLADSTIYNAAVPWISPTGSFSSVLGTQCPATSVGLCYSWAAGGSQRYGGLVAAGAVEAAHRKKEEERFMEISRCDNFHLEDGEVTPIETEEGKYECLNGYLDAETPIKIANDLSEAEYDECTSRAVNIVSICGNWSPYSLRFSKLLHAMCAADGMTMRKVIKQTELAYGDLCDATEYPDNSKLAYNLGMVGFLFVGFFFLILKPVDAWLQLRSARR